MTQTALIKLVYPISALWFWIGCVGPDRSQAPLFVSAPGAPVAVGPGSGEVVLADLDRDGHLDLLTKHLLQRCVAVRLGDGQGRFEAVPEAPMSFEYQPGAIAIGDVDNDGILDLGVASRDGDGEHVRIFPGDGRGGFSPVSRPPIVAGASIEVYKPSLRLVDLDEDGNLDIVTANGRRNRIEILFGDGRGGFSPGPSLSLEPGLDRYSFALGDVDGDGHLDLVSAGSTEDGGIPGRLSVERGDGKGAFTGRPGPPLSTLPAPRLATLADVNGDHHLDIVLSHSSHQLSLLLNDGKGMFAPAPCSPIDIGAEAFAVVVADVSNDRRNDLVAATVHSVTVLLGDDRGFVPAPGSPFSSGPGAYNVTVGDLNEDGKLDVAASSFEGDTVTVLLAR